MARIDTVIIPLSTGKGIVDAGEDVLQGRKYSMAIPQSAGHGPLSPLKLFLQPPL
jgi:hypothetical protein